MLTRLVAALLAILVAAACAASASAQGPSLARIAYSADADLYTIAADGSDRRLVANGASEPAWSPDGGALAWTRFQDDEDAEGSRVFVSVADGSGARPVSAPPRGAVDASPTWSPDGQRVAFVRQRYGSRKLVSTLISAAAAGGGERRIAEVSSSGYDGLASADWSPDGARVLVTVASFSDESPDAPQLHLVDVADGKRRPLLRNAGYGRWSPDGRQIVYVGDRPGCEDFCEELYVANADGGGRRRLTTNDARETRPAWSGAGDRITFVSDRNYPGSGGEVYSMGADGSCLTWLTNGTAFPYGPVFQPGAGRSSDPGACGATPREPLIETDTSELTRYDDVPIWWLGPRFGDLLLSEAEEESGNADFDYDDCARYEPSDCPPPVDLTNLPACASSFYFFGDGTDLSRHQGALLFGPYGGEGEEALELITGPTTVFVSASGAQSGAVLDAMRQFGEDAPPTGGLPRAELPVRYLRALERTSAAARKYGTRGAARRLGISTRRVRERLAVHRHLRNLGPFGRLACR
jgi:hypothetical protein